MRRLLNLISCLLPVLALALVAGSATVAQASDAPHWLWSGPQAKDGEEVYLRKHFELTALPASAKLLVSCDNHATVWINGTEILKNDEWSSPSVAEIHKKLKVGTNLIAVLAKNDTSAAGLLVRLRMKEVTGKTTDVVSNTSWLQGPEKDGWETVAFDDSSWKPAYDIGAVGCGPWGDIIGGGGVSGGSVPEVMDGFAIDPVYIVPRDEQGSWVSLTTDNKGRLLASAQDGWIYRITPAAVGEPPENTTVERVDLPIGDAHGLLYAHDSLYVMVNGNRSPGHSSGLYRLQSSHNDDHFDRITKLRDFSGEGEHGPHDLALGPDQKIYFAIGNMTQPIAHPDVSLPAPVSGDDLILGRYWDPNGFLAGATGTGGYIGCTDAEGKTWEVVSNGYRNIYDLTFDPNGELFTWDSDMEWDMGTPWYRPIRVIHTTSGSDLGWRSGSAKYPNWYADSLPPLLDIGPGCPTGMIFGYGAKFPAKYQRALFILDWTFGTIYAIHLQPHGATFTATKEEFVFGRPLPLTAMTVGHDGNMYFVVGGRGTPSAIYRIRYVGSESTEPVQAPAPTPAALLRHKLEAFHGHHDPGAVAFAWPSLGSPDLFIREAARIAIENQPVAEWQDRVFDEPNPQARITALIALARCGSKTLAAQAFASFLGLDLATMDTQAKLEAIRACQLIIIRLGDPDASTAQRLISEIDPLFPANDDRLNRELSSLLAKLGSQTVIAKVLAEMAKEEPPIVLGHDFDQLLSRNGGYAGPIAQMLSGKPQQMHIHYATVLAAVKDGWTPEQRLQFFTWFDKAENKSSGGNSYRGYIAKIKEAALDKVPASERQALLDRAKDPANAKQVHYYPQPVGPGHAWKTEELVQLAKTSMHKRNFENGRNMFMSSMCIICHRFGNDGGSVGPDLSGVGTRFGARDIIESIIEPSKVISDLYQTTVFTAKDGHTVSGRLISEDAKAYQVAVNPLDPTTLTAVPKDTLKSKAFTNISIMPPGLINRLNQDEALDLIAFLMASGNPEAAAFK